MTLIKFTTLHCLKAWLSDRFEESCGTPDWGQLLAIFVLDLR